jgi:hypothetical protein
MSSGVAASLRRILIANQHHRLLIVSTCLNTQNPRTFSMQYKDIEKAPHPFDYVNKNYSKFIFKNINSFVILFYLFI